MLDAASCPFVGICPDVVLNLDEYGLPKGDGEPVKVCPGCSHKKEF